MAATNPSSSIRQDAADLYDAATTFIRFYQFRDRNQALRSGLTVVQAYALDSLLAQHGQTLTSLAEALYLDKSTTSRVVASMERSGLVELTRPDHDRRSIWIEASAEGRRRYRHHRQSIERDNARSLASYSLAERRAAIRILRQLVERAAARARPAKAAR
jgi:DNA-binding MarR family transcriptional regulator